MFKVVYITAGSVDEAQNIAHALVSNNLAVSNCPDVVWSIVEHAR